jgi:hypothetical protein
MAVPNTNTFSLSEVCSELGLTGNDCTLAVCFLNVDPEKFYPRYVGLKDRLSNFRNYGAPHPIFDVQPNKIENLGAAAGQFEVQVACWGEWTAVNNLVGFFVSFNPPSGIGSQICTCVYDTSKTRGEILFTEVATGATVIVHAYREAAP